MITIPMRVSVTDVRIPASIDGSARIPVRVAVSDAGIPASVAVSMAGIPASVGASAVSLNASLGAAYQMREGEIYQGEYEFTPTQSEQTVNTAGKVLIRNIRINPIPSQYGLVTYNGSIITVS